MSASVNARAPDSDLILTQKQATTVSDSSNGVLSKCPKTFAEPALFGFMLRIDDRCLIGSADRGSFREMMTKTIYDMVPPKVDLKPQ